MKVINQNNKLMISENIHCAESILGRMKGLMFQDESGFNYDGMLIRPCNSIHTFFMKFSIDVFFLDQYGKVIKIINDMSPYRISPMVFSSFQVLELKSSLSLASKIKVGDSLEIIDD